MKSYSGKDVDEALRWVADVFMWSQTPIFLLGETLKAVKLEQNLVVEKLELGVRERHLTQDTVKLLKTFVPGIELEGKVISLESYGVPIEIKIIKRHYDFFDNQDFSFYNYDEYKTPNPWTTAYKSRYLIQ